MSKQPVVLITGCSEGGIGEYLALRFHEKKCRVFASARNVDSMANLKAKGIETVQLDITRDESMQAAVDLIISKAGRIDILVNNAGMSLYQPLADVNIAEAKKLFETNFFGLLSLTQKVIPFMVAQRKGKIVNIGSIVGVLSTPYSGIYCASKAAIHSLSDAMRVELKPFGIDVIVVAPGAIKSNISSNAKKVTERIQDGETKILKEGSIYAPLEKYVAKRANASQVNSTPTDAFANHVVDRVLNRPSPYLFFGNLSFLVPFVKRWFPTFVVDFLLARMAGLNTIS